MDDKDYKELMAFLGKQFGHIDEQLAEMRRDFATKDDLKPFATKDDLKPFATKDDLKPFATKDELQDMVRQNMILHEDTHHKLELVLEGLRSHAESNERVTSEITGKLDRLDRMEMHLMADIDDHDRRIKALEKKP